MISLKTKIFSLLARSTGSKKIFASSETELFNYITNTLRKSPFAEPEEKLYDKCNIEKETLNGLVYYRIIPKGITSDKVVLYSHGGGFIMEITKPHWSFIVETACETNTIFYVPIYPLAPEHECTETFNFLLSLYKNIILPMKPKHFYVMGDSAGGSISLSFAMFLKEQNLPQPQHIILISPCLKMNPGNTEEAIKIAAIDKSDPLLSSNSFNTIGKWWGGDLGTTHYMVSPAFGDTNGLGKITMLTGTNDILSVFCDSFYKKALESKIQLDYHKFKKMIHCWVFMPTKEAQNGKKIIYQALNS